MAKSQWLQEAVKFYHEKKRTNPNYKYKDALKELGKRNRSHKHEHKSSTRKARKSRRRRKH
jgi:hypothetical protein